MNANAGAFQRENQYRRTFRARAQSLGHFQRRHPIRRNVRRLGRISDVRGQNVVMIELGIPNRVVS